MSWINNSKNREGVLGEIPALAKNFSNVYEQFWKLPQIPARTLELCRLRLAQLHGSQTEWQRREVALDQAIYSKLENWPQSSCFSEAEKSCLAFTEVYAMDVQAITDEQAESVKDHYGDAGLVALIEALGFLDGMTRLSLLWQLDAEGQ